MPWSDKDAKRHTRKANTGAKKDQWSAVANAVLKKTGDDGKAVRVANGVIARGYRKMGSAK